MGKQNHFLFRWIGQALSLAVFQARPDLSREEATALVVEEAEEIIGRVRGNKGEGTPISPADKRLMTEATLRRCLEILEAAEVAS